MAQSNDCRHFTGPKGGKPVARKSSSRAERKKGHGTHKSKYAHLAPVKKTTQRAKELGRFNPGS